MKKTFPFIVEGKEAPRVVEAIKHEVRKYLKRERRKKLPEGVDFWDFDCKIGKGKETPQVRAISDVITAIDEVAGAGAEAIYVEILAKPGIKPPKAPRPKTDEAKPEGEKE